MTKEELLKIMKENLNLFSDAEKDAIEGVLEFNTKGNPFEGKKPDESEKEKEKPEETKKEGEAEAKPETNAEASEGEKHEEAKSEEKGTQEANPEKQEEENPKEQPSAEKPMADPRVDELVKQFSSVLGKLANIEDVISKIVVVKPLDEKPSGGYGETAKGNPSEVKNSSATDDLIRSMGGYGR